MSLPSRRALRLLDFTHSIWFRAQQRLVSKKLLKAWHKCLRRKWKTNETCAGEFYCAYNLAGSPEFVHQLY